MVKFSYWQLNPYSFNALTTFFTHVDGSFPPCRLTACNDPSFLTLLAGEGGPVMYLVTFRRVCGFGLSSPSFVPSGGDL